MQHYFIIMNLSISIAKSTAYEVIRRRTFLYVKSIHMPYKGAFLWFIRQCVYTLQNIELQKKKQKTKHKF